MGCKPAKENNNSRNGQTFEDVNHMAQQVEKENREKMSENAAQGKFVLS